MKTKIEKKLKRKTSPNIVETIISGKKNNSWLKVANVISRPRRKKFAMNLDEINSEAKEGEVVVVPGKVLGRGDVSKKIKIVALDFSESTKEKLKKSKIEIVRLNDEIKKNPSAKGLKILGA